MKTIDLSNKYGLTALNFASNRDISTGFCGDLLSIVMSKAPTDSVWFTVMNNVNVIAVASLVDVSAVVICDAEVNKELIEKAKENNINLYSSKEDVFSTLKRIGEL